METANDRRGCLPPTLGQVVGLEDECARAAAGAEHGRERVGTQIGTAPSGEAGWRRLAEARVYGGGVVFGVAVDVEGVHCRRPIASAGHSFIRTSERPLLFPEHIQVAEALHPDAVDPFAHSASAPHQPLQLVVVRQPDAQELRGLTVRDQVPALPFQDG